MDERVDWECAPASVAAAVTGGLGSAGGQALIFSAPKPLLRAHAGRRRLWELPPKHHCVLLGAAFDARELRRMFRRSRFSDWGTAGDYELHSSAVCFAKDRNGFSTLAQRSLDERFRSALARFGAARTASEVLDAWRALAAGGEAVAAYWAALTHPQCDAELDEVLSREMHMIAHEAFSARRATLRQARALDDRAARLLTKQAQIQEDIEALRRENRRLREALQAAQSETRQAQGELERSRSGESVRAQQAHIAELERALEASRDETAAAQRALRNAVRRAERLELAARSPENRTACAREAVAKPGETVQPAPRPDLHGRRVLCIGGKTALVPQYRAVVEGARGEFAHHDGGIDHHVGRLPAMLASAHAVVCLAGDCSHAAYRIAKRYCKAKGKPCTLIGNSSVTAVAHCVGVLGSSSEERQWNKQASHLRRFISGPSTVMSASSRSCPA